jgi:hypothetical protein
VAKKTKSKQPRFIKDEILMYGGIAVIVFAAMPFLRFAQNPVIEDASEIAPIVGNVFIVLGGVVMFLVGLRFRRLENRLGKLQRALEVTDRITITDLARNLRLSVDQARQGVVYLVGGGFVPHRYDHKEDAVVKAGVEGTGSSGADPQAVGWFKLPATCTGCGAPQQTMVPAGGDPKCEYCGARLPAEFVPPPKKKQTQAMAAAGQAPVAESASAGFFSGNWFTLILLFLVFWPAALYYLARHASGSGIGQLMRFRG